MTATNANPTEEGDRPVPPIQRTALITLVLLAVLFSATGAVQAQTTLEKAREQGFVYVGFANEQPYAYATPDGQLTGEAVEIARVILERLGIPEMRGVLTEFGSLIPGLRAGRFDIITAGMFVTPERCQQVAFANPEYSLGVALGVRSGNPLNLKSYTDIADNPDVRVAAMSGGVEIGYMLASGVAESQIVVVNDQPTAVATLLAGRADAVTMTGPALQGVLDTLQNPDVERVMDFEQPIIDGQSVRGYGAAAFRPEDTDFVEAYNQELERLKASGELLEILQRFGFTEAELPGDVTAGQLCL